LPSGKNHLKAEIAALAAIIAIITGANFAFELAHWEDEFQPLALVFAAAYLFSALLLSPDLDLARSDPHNRWGYLRVCWIPYAKLFRHRGLSHNPLIGPLSRLLYLGGWAASILAGLHYIFAVEMNFLRDGWDDLHAAPLSALSLGLILPNEIHILLDRAYSDPR